MRKYSIFVLVLVLTAALFTGCGCRNSQPMNTSAPTMPPVTTMPTTEATTVPTTEEPTRVTEPAMDETIEDGNGPLPTNATAGEDGNTANSRSRSSTNENIGANYSTAPTNGSARNMPRG